jgi:hypothetical protein
MKKQMRYTPYFHNYEYRHLLRSSAYMAEWREFKSYPPITFEKLYRKLRKELRRRSLSLDGFSLNHTLTIASVFKFTPQQTIKLIRAYHINSELGHWTWQKIV